MKSEMKLGVAKSGMVRAAHRGICLQIVAFVIMVIGVSGCLSSGQKTTVNTVLDVAKYACIVANAEFPSPKIQEVCQISDDLIPALQAVLNDLVTHDARVQARHEAAVVAAQSQTSAKKP